MGLMMENLSDVQILLHTATQSVQPLQQLDIVYSDLVYWGNNSKYAFRQINEFLNLFESFGLTITHSMDDDDDLANDIFVPTVWLLHLSYRNQSRLSRNCLDPIPSVNDVIPSTSGVMIGNPMQGDQIDSSSVQQKEIIYARTNAQLTNRLEQQYAFDRNIAAVT